MKPPILLEQKPNQSIIDHALEAFPNECCGFLYGHEGDKRIITKAVAVTNSKVGDQSRRFEIAPLDYIKAEQYALKTNLQLLGIYHSHPNHPAIASVHDLAKAMPYFSYVIVSVMNGLVVDTKSWQLAEEERTFEEEVVFIESLDGEWQTPDDSNIQTPSAVRR